MSLSTILHGIVDLTYKIMYLYLWGLLAYFLILIAVFATVALIAPVGK